MNEQNLKSNSERTPTERSKLASKAGKASGRSRREKATLKDAMQKVFDGSYSDKDGHQHTGAEITAMTLMKIASDKNHKQCVQAIRLIREILGEDVSAEQVKEDKAKLKLLEKQIELTQTRIDNAGW